MTDAIGKRNEEATAVLDAIPAAAESHPGSPLPSAVSAPPPQIAFDSPTRNQQRFEFAITRGRTVVLTVPSDLNAKDIKVIRKQVELLELQVGLDDEIE